MRTLFRIVILIVFIVSLSAPLFAASGEVVKFTDGRYLEVHSHEFTGEAVKLILENSSVLILPADRCLKRLDLLVGGTHFVHGHFR